MTPAHARFLLAALPFLLAACAGPSVPSTSDCSVDSQCKPGFICSAEKVCAPAATPDAGHDAGTDGGSDGGADAGPAQGKLTLSPAALALDATVGVAASTGFTLGNAGSAPLAFSLACTGAAATPASGNIAADDSVAIALAVPAPAAAGTKSVTCTATTSDGTGGPLTFAATLNVAPPPQGHLTLSPATASTAAQSGQAGQSSFTLGNDGSATLGYTVACTGGVPTPASGTLTAAGNAAVTVAFGPFPTAGAQTVTCTASTSDGAGGPLAFTLTVNVGAAAVGTITRTPASVAGTGLVGAGGSTSFSVGNSGTASLDYTVACTLGATPAPASGTLAPAASQAVAVTYATWTTAGTKSVVCTLKTANGAGGPLDFIATVAVTAPLVGKLAVSPATRAVSAVINTPSSTTFSLGNAGTATLNAGITCTNGAVANPTTAAVAVGATPSIGVALPSFAAAGTQTFSCTVDPTDTPDASLSVTITLTVTLTAATSPCGAKGAVWDDLNSLSGSQLRDALNARITNHTSISYSAAGEKLHGATSIDQDASGKIECIYSGEIVSAASNSFNTEHSWPQSFFNEVLPEKSDLNHLFPTDSAPNGQRANYAFGNLVGSPTYVSTTTCGTAPNCTAGGVSRLGVDGAGRHTFEVRQKQRGNTARGMFYFATRYPADVDSSDSTCYGATDSSARPRCFPAYEQAALKQWNIDDPVDANECARNDKVEAIQGKRNPFIDRPDFIEKIGSW
jgi:endonuclease I